MIQFHSPAQEHLYRRVLQGLESVGYAPYNDYVGPFLKEDYSFTDWFVEANPQRRLKAIAFAQSPPSYSTATFSVILADQRSGVELVKESEGVGRAPTHSRSERTSSTFGWLGSRHPRPGRSPRSSRMTWRPPSHGIARSGQGRRCFA